jgi:hypothetical protein
MWRKLYQRTYRLSIKKDQKHPIGRSEMFYFSTTSPRMPMVTSRNGISFPEAASA